MSFGTKSGINWGSKKDLGRFWPVLLHFEVPMGFENSLKIKEAQLGGTELRGSIFLLHHRPNLVWSRGWNPFGADLDVWRPGCYSIICRQTSI